MPLSNATSLTSRSVTTSDLERSRLPEVTSTSPPSSANPSADVASAADSIRSFVSQQQQRLRQRSAPPRSVVVVPSTEPDSELDDIARQIADHAEVLYQTWRARGLTPNDRLLHSANTASLNSAAAKTLARHLRPAVAASGYRAASAPRQWVPGGSESTQLYAGAFETDRLQPAHEYTIPIQLESGDKVNAPNKHPVQNSSPELRQSSESARSDLAPSARDSLQALVRSFVLEDKARRGSNHAISYNSNSSDESFMSSHVSSPNRSAVAEGRSSPGANHTSRLQVTTNGQTRVIHNGFIPSIVDTSVGNIDTTSSDSTTLNSSSVSENSDPYANYSNSSALGIAPTVSSGTVADEVRRHETRLRSSSLVAAADSSSSLSTVDYAKRRLQDSPGPSLVAQRMTDARALTLPTASAGSSVQETRSRYDHGQVNISDAEWRTDWLSSEEHSAPFTNNNIHNSGHVTGSSFTNGRTPTEPCWRRKRIQTKPTATTSPSSDQQAARVLSPLPHPQLTAEQRQHIRERCMAPYSAAGVAVRPFLTRGSVAERVLIFERCPVEVVDRRGPAAASTGGVELQALHAWRGHNDVRNKTQTYNRHKDPLNAELESNSTKLDASHSPAPSPSSPRPSSTSTSIPNNSSVDRTPARDSQTHASSYSSSTSSSRRQLPVKPAVATRSSRRANISGSSSIPQFYFPNGRPEVREKQEALLVQISKAFSARGSLMKDEFFSVTKACGCPRYWRLPLFQAVDSDRSGQVTCSTFVKFWKRLTSKCHDPASRFVFVVTSGEREFILPEDLVPLVQDVVESHPGLNFLKDAVQFHSRYIHTVIARIFYCVNRSWSGRITLPELRRSNLLDVIASLELQDDINQIVDYFSYEHFYVIYCKFWELDTDHDLLIDKDDLARHDDHAVSSRVIERVFSGAVSRGGLAPSDGAACKHDKMSYTEFVWFLLSEEDKRHPTSIEYWFRCMDLDGDGFISMYEMEYFYEEQLQRLDSLGIDALPFEDCLCWMLDMVQPRHEGRIALSDLKRCQLANVFFDTFCNLEKYLEHDQRDPFALSRDREDGKQMSDWERYAAEEYELLVAEETAADPDSQFAYDDAEECLPDEGCVDNEEEEEEEDTLKSASTTTEPTDCRMKNLSLGGATFLQTDKISDNLYNIVSNEQNKSLL